MCSADRPSVWRQTLAKKMLEINSRCIAVHISTEKNRKARPQSECTTSTCCGLELSSPWRERAKQAPVVWAGFPPSASPSTVPACPACDEPQCWWPCWSFSWVRLRPPWNGSGTWSVNWTWTWTWSGTSSCCCWRRTPRTRSHPL